MGDNPSQYIEFWIDIWNVGAVSLLASEFVRLNGRIRDLAFEALGAMDEVFAQTRRGFLVMTRMDRLVCCILPCNGGCLYGVDYTLAI